MMLRKMESRKLDAYQGPAEVGKERYDNAPTSSALFSKIKQMEEHRGQLPLREMVCRQMHVHRGDSTPFGQSYLKEREGERSVCQ